MEFVTIDQGTVSDGTDIVIHDSAINEFSPSFISDTYFHLYGAHYSRSITTLHEPTTCNFTYFDCTVGNHTLILKYPKDAVNITVPNTPSFAVTDNGSVCFDTDCMTYDINVQVYNLNWRVQGNTGAAVGPFVSPNGYNVIPILGLVGAIYALWYFSQPQNKRYRSRQ